MDGLRSFLELQEGWEGVQYRRCYYSYRCIHLRELLSSRLLGGKREEGRRMERSFELATSSSSSFSLRSLPAPLLLPLLDPLQLSSYLEHEELTLSLRFSPFLQIRLDRSDLGIRLPLARRGDGLGSLLRGGLREGYQGQDG